MQAGATSAKTVNVFTPYAGMRGGGSDVSKQKVYERRGEV